MPWEQDEILSRGVARAGGKINWFHIRVCPRDAVALHVFSLLRGSFVGGDRTEGFVGLTGPTKQNK